MTLALLMKSSAQNELAECFKQGLSCLLVDPELLQGFLVLWMHVSLLLFHSETTCKLLTTVDAVSFCTNRSCQWIAQPTHGGSYIGRRQCYTWRL